MLLFEQNAGGAPANVAAALAKLGRSVAFIGKSGCDMNGVFLRRSLEEAGVDTRGLLSCSDVNTSMAFVTLSPEGERDFSFIRDADTKIQIDEVNRDMILQSRVFHFGSLSMTHDPARQTTLQALCWAREAGCIVSYDPNYRALLWPDPATAAKIMSSVVPQVDILKVSEDELVLMTGHNDLETGGKELLRRGPVCVAVTQGSNGATVFLPSGFVQTPTYPGQVIDTTGAGDAFMGGFLSQCLTRGIHPRDMSIDEAREISMFAHAVATCCVAARGGIPAMPSLETVQKLLAQ